MRRTRNVLVLVLLSVGFLTYLLFNVYITYAFDSYTVPISTGEENRPPANTNSSARILLVSALYPLSKAKHSSADYAYWLDKFIGPLTTDVYFFTTPEMAGVVREAVDAHRQADHQGRVVTINTTYASPFDVPPLRGLRGAYERMHAKDREAFRHSPELYAVWNAKPFFLSEGLRSSGSEYAYAFWCDAGSFRGEHVYRAWPDPARVEEVWREGRARVREGVGADEMVFVPLAGVPGRSAKGWKAEMGPLDWDVSEGSFFGGMSRAVEWWRKVFYAYHDAYLERGMFVGKDQTVMNAVLMVYGGRVLTVWYGDADAPAHAGMPPALVGEKKMLGECGDAAGWWYYQWWLAGEEERKGMRAIWERREGVERWWWWWRLWERLIGRGASRERMVEGCRMTRMQVVEEVWKRRFGKGWVVPEGLHIRR